MQPRLDRFGHRIACRAKVTRRQPLAQQRSQLHTGLPCVAAWLSGSPASIVPAMWLLALDQRQSPAAAGHAHRHRVQFDITDRGHQMRIVHRITGKPPPERIAAPSLAKVDPACIAAVRLPQRSAQAIRILRHEDQMDVVVHQAPGKAARALRLRCICHQRQISMPIFVPEKHRQTPVSALGDMMRNLRDHDAREPGHLARIATRALGSIKYTVPGTPVPGTPAVPELPLSRNSCRNSCPAEAGGVPPNQATLKIHTNIYLSLP